MDPEYDKKELLPFDDWTIEVLRIHPREFKRRYLTPLPIEFQALLHEYKTREEMFADFGIIRGRQAWSTIESEALWYRKMRADHRSYRQRPRIRGKRSLLEPLSRSRTREN